MDLHENLKGGPEWVKAWLLIGGKIRSLGSMVDIWLHLGGNGKILQLCSIGVGNGFCSLIYRFLWDFSIFKTGSPMGGIFGRRYEMVNGEEDWGNIRFIRCPIW